MSAFSFLELSFCSLFAFFLFRRARLSFPHSSSSFVLLYTLCLTINNQHRSAPAAIKGVKCDSSAQRRRHLLCEKWCKTFAISPCVCFCAAGIARVATFSCFARKTSAKCCCEREMHTTELLNARERQWKRNENYDNIFCFFYFLWNVSFHCNLSPLICCLYSLLGRNLKLNLIRHNVFAEQHVYAGQSQYVNIPFISCIWLLYWREFSRWTAWKCPAAASGSMCEIAKKKCGCSLCWLDVKIRKLDSIHLRRKIDIHHHSLAVISPLLPKMNFQFISQCRN